MTLPYHTQTYKNWAPVLARVLFAGQFLLGAFFKIPGTQGFQFEVAQTAAAGIPYAAVFVFLAFLLEVGAALALLIGWHIRAAAFVLAVFTFALALIFYTNFSDPMTMGMFVSHLGFIAGLLYVSVYGAQFAGLDKNNPSR